jgi:hypothetical protein
MRGATAKNNKNKLPITFQIPLLVFSRGMIFFSSRFSGIAVVFLMQETGPKKENPTASKVLAMGFKNCPAYDPISRSSASRRQKTHTDSRNNRGKPAWSSGRGKSSIKGTKWRLQSQ